MSKLSGKTPYKKTQLKTLIAFDRVMVLTPNLVHIFIMSKDMLHFYDDVIKNFDAPKTKKLILSFLARNSGLNLFIHRVGLGYPIKILIYNIYNFINIMNVGITV